MGARVNGDWSNALNTYANENGGAPLSSADIKKHGKASVEVQDAEGKIYALSDSKRQSFASGVSFGAPELPNWVLNGGAQVQVMLDGPYGGSGVDLGEYESVFLVAGGSGITFTVGLLDDIVGRCSRLERAGGERTRAIEFVWCIRSFGKCLSYFE